MTRIAATGMVLLCLLSASCSQRMVPGAAKPEAGASATTTTTEESRKLTPANASSVLLKRSQLGEIVGDTDMKEDSSFTKPAASRKGVEPRACIARVSLATADYGVPSLEGLVGNSNSGVGRAIAGQMVAVFDSEASARIALGNELSSLDRFCPDGTQITLVNTGVTQTWTAGSIEPPKDSWFDPAKLLRVVSVTRLIPGTRACSHVSARYDNIMIVSLVCGTDDSVIGKANTVVDRIAANLPK